MFLPVAPVFLAVQLVIPAADQVPRFNIDANCRADAAASAAIAVPQSAAKCKQDEQNAHVHVRRDESTQLRQNRGARL